MTCPGTLGEMGNKSNNKHWIHIKFRIPLLNPFHSQKFIHLPPCSFLLLCSFLPVELRTLFCSITKMYSTTMSAIVGNLLSPQQCGWYPTNLSSLGLLRMTENGYDAVGYHPILYTFKVLLETRTVKDRSIGISINWEVEGLVTAFWRRYFLTLQC